MKTLTLLGTLLVLGFPVAAQEDEEEDGSHDPYDQTTALIDAVRADDAKQIKILLDDGHDPNEVVGAGPALAWARSAAAVGLLVAAGAQPNAEFHGTSVFGFQVQQADNLQVIAALLDAGARVADESLFTVAEISDNPLVVKALVTHGANLNARDDLGRTAFLVAAGQNKNVQVVRAFLDGGSNPATVDDEGQTALMNAVVWRNSLEVFRFLKTASGGVAQLDKKGRSVEALIKLYISENREAFLAALQH